MNNFPLLKDRILSEGKCLDGGILKVDGFINHQMDPDLMMAIGKEFAERFKDSDYNKIVTIEASGIAPAIAMGIAPLTAQWCLSRRRNHPRCRTCFRPWCTLSPKTLMSPSAQVRNFSSPTTAFW